MERPLTSLYRPPIAMLTDLYQLTMAYGYWKLGRSETEAVFHLFFRKTPFQGGYAVAAGLGTVLEYLESWKFDDSDVAYLQTLTGNDDQPLFDSAFLNYLSSLKLSCDVDAMPEGTLAFAHEPLLRVTGPILQCQLLETALLNLINFPTLIATKASRICAAAQGESVLEFGLRRAQGIDGGVSASRAAYVGGCAATSNVMAGKLYGIPVRGTHAHSWVMSFDSEQEAFEGYAQVMPNNCVLLVDTYDTLDGVRRAVDVGRKLRDRGHEMVGIRLDSGDLATLSIEARRILDDGGFPDALIVASNDLDEHIIESLKHQDARIAVWGVGTKLATGYDQPALGGVYKLGAIRDAGGDWQPKVKLSEQAIKSTIPGVLQVRRYEDEQGLVADVIYDETTGIDPRAMMTESMVTQTTRPIPQHASSHDVLVPVVCAGKLTEEIEDVHRARDRTLSQLPRLRPAVRRILNPDPFVTGIDIGVHELRQQLFAEATAD